MHVLLMAVGSVVIGLPLLWLGCRGWFGSRKAFAVAQDELRQRGRVLLTPTLAARILGAGPLIMDRSGLTIIAWRSSSSYLWLDVTAPFEQRSCNSNSSILFLHRVKNPNYGKWKLFRNTRDISLKTRQTIPSAYGIGWDNLLLLLNEARSLGLSEEVPTGLPNPLPVMTAEILLPLPMSIIRPVHPDRQPAISDLAIKSGLALAVVAAFGYMVSSFSWNSGDQIVLEESVGEDGVISTAGGEIVRRPPTSRSSNINPKQHVVRGSTRSDGTYVAPYVATNPDNNRANNFSSRNNAIQNPDKGGRR